MIPKISNFKLTLTVFTLEEVLNIDSRRVKRLVLSATNINTG